LAIGIPVALGLVAASIGWLAHSLLYGAFAALATWVIAQVVFTIWAIKRPAVDAKPATKPKIHTTPSEILSGSCIANQEVSIEDLTREGFVRDSKIESVEFRNCTIRGPGVITLEAPPPTHPVRGSSSATAMLWFPGTCHIEGSPESVLWEVPSGGVTAKGVVYLVGCAFRQVTFRDIAIAGSPNGLRSWTDNCTFSGGDATSWKAKEDVLKKENERLKAAQAERDKAERNRAGLIHELYQLHADGDILLRHDYPRSDLEDWWERTSELIRRALLKDEVDELLKRGLSAA
jgi:hypothetical protein